MKVVVVCCFLSELLASLMRHWSVITGCSSGIGAALAVRLSEMNYNVLAIGRRKQNLIKTKQNSTKSENIHICVADIGLAADRDRIVSFIPNNEQNSIKYLIHNAAIGDPAHLKDINLSHWKYSLAVNVTAPLFLTQQFVDRLNENNGRILHIGTGVAFNPQIGTATYGITKCAFHRLYQQIKVELQQSEKYTNVHIGSFSPGVVITEGVNDHIEKAKKLNLPHAKYFDDVLENGMDIPMEKCIDFMIDLLMKTDDETFGKKEWSMRDNVPFTINRAKL